MYSRVLRQLFALCLALPGVAASQQHFSPYVGDPLPREVFWGDTHLHSSLSTDAFGFGVTLGPDAAYRFAAGEQVTTSHGLPARLGRPLDFVVLADHAESFGLMNLVRHADPRLMSDPEIAEWHQQMHGTPEQVSAFQRRFLSREGRWVFFGKLDTISSPQLQLDVWQDALSIAEQHNRPGVFTTLLGYEWSAAPGGSNLHRVVMFRDDAALAGAVAPLSSRTGDDPVQLWQHLADYEQRTGGQVLAIPHNGNLSNGLMFPTTERLHGRAVDENYAALRARWEPVVEVTQIKGDGETHPLLSPDDEFADYETWDAGNFQGVPKTPAMLPHEYARSALGLGLKLQQRLGINPYRFGMLGSTDSHTALATAGEDNFFGKHSGVEPNPQRWRHPVGRAGEQVVAGWQQAASGYAAVWATGNTRAQLWDAIKRREVYATTGPRMTVRLFGGWEFTAADATAPDIAAIGYAGGVPMGGVLAAPPDPDVAPAFLVMASKDPVGANLDRIQVVKGWLDARGQSRERVYDVVWSGERQPGRSGRLPDIASTASHASGGGLQGAVQLATVWRDPHFNPAQPAFYYARVIETPTPRWTAYDVNRFGITMDADVPMQTRERAYTSPIWYGAGAGANAGTPSANE